MTTFERKYSTDEKEAFLYAYEDRRLRPLTAVLAMAERGELLTKDGRRVRPFTLNYNTAKGWSRAARHKARGRISGTAHDNPEGTIEALRKRLIALADDELAYCERQRSGKRDPEHMRQIARAIREAAAIPVKGEPRGRAPGEKDQGQKESGETTGGMAGSLLRAHRAKPAPEQPSLQTTQAENGHTRATTVQTHTQEQTANHTDPGRSTELEPSV